MSIVIVEIVEGIAEVSYNGEGCDVMIIDWDLLMNGSCPFCEMVAFDPAALDDVDNYKHCFSCKVEFDKEIDNILGRRGESR